MTNFIVLGYLFGFIISVPMWIKALVKHDDFALEESIVIAIIAVCLSFLWPISIAMVSISKYVHRLQQEDAK